MSLNQQQREAVEYTEGPLLLIAGPGSGKTRVITHRIAHIVATGLAPGAGILAVTFTKKAAGEMQQRACALLTGAAATSAPTVTTFHAFCVKLLRKSGYPLAAIRPGFTPRFSIYDESNQLTVMKQCYYDLGLKKEDFKPPRAVLAAISRHKSAGRSLAEFLEEAARAVGAPGGILRQIGMVFQAYEAELHRNNALDFDDLLGETVRLLRHDAPTRSAWNERIAYLMVDEFQDTNQPQYNLMRLLTEQRRNVCVVGDDDQGIYSWRGATSGNIAVFKREFPEVKVIRLEQNYRSTHTIVAASREVIENNKTREFKKLWTESLPGSRIGLFTARNDDEEAAFVAEFITWYHSQHPGSGAAVLYRSNWQSRKLEQILLARGLQYRLVRGTSFFQRAEISDVIAYLRLATGTEDQMSILRVLNTPSRGIGGGSLDKIRARARQHTLSLWAAIEQMAADRKCAPRLHASLNTFLKVIADLAAAAADGRSLSNLIRFICERTGYDQMLTSQDSEEAEERLENLRELTFMAEEAVKRGEGAEEFIDYLTMASDADTYDETAPISLMTLHTSKGLEFPLVIICGLEDGILPHIRTLRSMDKESMEEERRLFYVGMTRAEQQLVLTRARFRPQGSNGPSQFLEELPKSLTFKLQGSDDGANGYDLEKTYQAAQRGMR